MLYFDELIKDSVGDLNIVVQKVVFLLNSDKLYVVIVIGWILVKFMVWDIVRGMFIVEKNDFEY